jgi:hypothetical protein
MPEPATPEIEVLTKAVLPMTVCLWALLPPRLRRTFFRCSPKGGRGGNEWGQDKAHAPTDFDL